MSFGRLAKRLSFEFVITNIRGEAIGIKVYLERIMVRLKAGRVINSERQFN